MRAPTSASPTGHQAAPEELSWDRPVRLHAESRAPLEDEAPRGFLLRLHTDPACPARLVPDGALVLRSYEQARADTICTACGVELVASSHSSVVGRLREAERTLHKLRGRSTEGPMPREIVHCRALRFEAETMVSTHPDAAELAVRVSELAGAVAEALRDAMAAYDRRR